MEQTEINKMKNEIKVLQVKKKEREIKSKSKVEAEKQLH